MTSYASTAWYTLQQQLPALSLGDFRQMFFSLFASVLSSLCTGKLTVDSSFVQRTEEEAVWQLREKAQPKPSGTVSCSSMGAIFTKCHVRVMSFGPWDSGLWPLALHFVLQVGPGKFAKVSP